MGAEEENLNSSTSKGVPKDLGSVNVNRNGSLTNVEGTPAKLPYPKSVFFIVSNEFCERFNYYGMRTILALFLTQKLLYDDDTATVIYHTFTCLVYFMCPFGAILSDSWLGKFKTIMYLSIVYSIGSFLISFGAIPTLNLPIKPATFLGLALIAIGSGGIKPCVAAFGGDQFKLPAQIAQMATYFSIFYFSINCGSTISTAVTPILRQDVGCFGDLDCFPLAFGVPGVLMVASIFVFILGKPLYKMIPPSGNMVVEVSKCIGNAISTKGKQKKINPREHWLDYAEEKYGKKIVEDTKILLKVLTLYIPLPLFWALFDQQGSRWTFQATRMDGDIGFYNVKPDQMQIFNPFLILIFIPLYEVVFYPLLSLIGVRRPLQKLTLGGILAGVAFLLSAAVELKLEETYPVLPGAGEAQFRVFNSFPCNYTGTTTIPGFEKLSLGPYGSFEEKHVHVNATQENKFAYTLNVVGTNENNCPNTLTGSIHLSSATARSIFLTGATLGVNDSYIDDPNKSRSGFPSVRLLTVCSEKKPVHVFNSEGDKVHSANTTDRKIFTVVAGTYNILIDQKPVTTVTLKQGSVSTILLRETRPGHFEHNLHEIAPPNSMNMMWLAPQYVVMTLGEVMFSVTGLSFSYAQAPESMKSVLQACWLLAVAFGNIIVVIVAGARLFTSQVHEFLLFAILMFVDMIVFMFLAYYFKSVEQTSSDELTENEHLREEEKAIVPSAPATQLTASGHTNDGFKE